MMKIERLVDGRRVKQRCTGGIQPPYQDNIGKYLALIAGLFFTLQERLQPIESARSIWGGTMAGPTLSRPVKQTALTPYLVGVRIDINTQRVGQRRSNEICIDKLYERSHKQMEGVCNEKKSSKHSAHHLSGHAAACGLLGHTNAGAVSPTHDKAPAY